MVSVLNKNGQEIDSNYIANTLKKDGIILQKYIRGNDYAIGFFKPLKVYNNKFSLGIVDLDISDVLTDGTAHYGDVIHYEGKYINKILKNTIFDKQPELIFFTIEILVYLMCLNEKLIDSPEEFENFNFEDFGIQFMVDNITGEIGLIEINGRTPSHNFNHFNLLSMYGKDFLENFKLPTCKVFCTSTKLIKIVDFYKMIKEEKDENKLIEYLINEIKIKYNKKCQLVSFGVEGEFFLVYYIYYLQEKDILQDIKEEITYFFRKSMYNFRKI